MNMNQYQSLAMNTCKPSSRYIEYMVLGLTSEAGEVAGKLKKYIRDKTPLGELDEDLAKEIGDCLWYIAGIAEVLGIDLNAVAIDNLEKLRSRKARNVIAGSGDER